MAEDQKSFPDEVDGQPFKRDTLPVRSAEISENITGFPVERLKRAFAWLDKTRGMPKGVALAKDVALWFARVETLREREDDLFAEGTYEGARAEHKLIVARLIAEGEALLKKFSRAGVSKLPSDVTFEDIQAAVDSLHMTFRSQHAPENTPAVNALIGQLFNGS
jgi:hypothetical protein